LLGKTKNLLFFVAILGAVMRPYVIINCACSADGKIATAERKQTEISSDEDMKRVHNLRASVDAILVGIGTIMADDPHLTIKAKYVKDLKKIENPTRIVIDSNAIIPPNARVLDDEAATIVVCAKKPKDRIENAEILVCGKGGKVDLEGLMGVLHERGIKRLLVEGGGEMIWSFLKDKLVDELKIFVGNIIIGGRKAPTVADGNGARDFGEAVKLDLKKVTRMDGGILLEYEVI
jgi:2,5-diamino-6-(ribosylamino)-4(3H)-pyrimidinone 5'-phosphate reductase